MAFGKAASQTSLRDRTTGDIAQVVTRGDGIKALATDSVVSFAYEPPVDYSFEFAYLEYTGSKDMTVDGSTTPVQFTLGPSGSDVILIRELRIFFQDGGEFEAANFGNLSALTNGLLVDKVLNGNTRTIATIQDNRDLSLVFLDDSTGPSLQGNLSTDLTINQKFTYAARLYFDPVIELEGTTGDLLRVTVRDDLTAITNLNVLAKYFINRGSS